MKVGNLSNANFVPNGATWHRVDFHLHTPGVSSFTCPQGADPTTEKGRLTIVEEYVKRLVDSGITLCAITDYNGIREEWFSLIQSRAAEYGITVFPGAELSLNSGKYGLHLLCVFPQDAEPKAINTAIQSLHRYPGQALLRPDGKHEDIDLRTNLPDAVMELRRQFGCLLILPHPTEKNGVCTSFQPKIAAEIIRDLDPDAIEHCPSTEMERLASTNILSREVLSRLAQVEFSDAHSLDDIGAKTRNDGKPRATWLKLSNLELSAIRLALRDPETRVAVGTVPEPRHTRLLRMEVEGSGFLGNLRLAWNPDLNVIIGGRGAGKSAVIETLRYALNLPPYSDETYRDSLVRHALGSGGRVSLLLERPSGEGSLRYRVERVLGEEPRVYDESGQRVDVAPADLFGPGGSPVILGQREIYTVTGSDEYRLRLLDNLIGEEVQQRADAVRESIELLRDNAQKLIDLTRKLSKRDELVQRLRTIEHEIEVYEREGVAEKLRTAMNLKTDGQHLRTASETVKEARRRFRDALTDIESMLSRAREGLSTGMSTQKQILQDAYDLVGRLVDKLVDLRTQVDELFTNTAEELQKIENRWQAALDPLEKDLNRIKQELQNDALDPDRLLKLTEEKAKLTPRISELEELAEQKSALLKERQTLIDTFKERRLEEHRLRRERAEVIGTDLGGRLKIQVVYKGQKDEYQRQLSRLLKGSGVTEDAIRRLCAPDATDGIALAEAVRTGVSEVVDRYGLTRAMAERLRRWLTADDETRLYELETLVPPDAVHVELRVDGEYRALPRLSVGQRATAILLLLFALRGRILVLDQPEDDLDNRFVYEDIVTLLREQKGLKKGRDRRQIIAATHNANIPVLGDAEQVVALEAREGHAEVVSRASIDDPETRRLIKSIMEGGEEAFRRRAEKYGAI